MMAESVTYTQRPELFAPADPTARYRDQPRQHLEPLSDRWTVIILNSRGKLLGAWLGVKGATPQQAISHVYWHNLPKEKRLYVCEAIAYRQDEAAVQHMSPRLTLDLADFEDTSSTDGDS